jgi:hypothetical protein
MSEAKRESFFLVWHHELPRRNFGRQFSGPLLRLPENTSEKAGPQKLHRHQKRNGNRPLMNARNRPIIELCNHPEKTAK